MLIDTHAHINFPDFEEDRTEIIRDCLNKDIWMINVGTNYQSSAEVVALSGLSPFGVYAAVGIHPENLDQEYFNSEQYERLIFSEQGEKNKKIVALGEIGLDYWRKPKTKKQAAAFKERQKNLFLEQLAFALSLDLPVIIHCRKAHQDLLAILEAFKSNGSFQGVIHCFTGDWSVAQRYLAMGFYLGFNGIIFKMGLGETIRKMPLDRMLVETDCPFLIPPQAEQDDKEKRNDPRYLKYIVETIAAERKAKFETIAGITTNNAKTLFKLAK